MFEYAHSNITNNCILFPFLFLHVHRSWTSQPVKCWLTAVFVLRVKPPVRQPVPSLQRQQRQVLFLLSSDPAPSLLDLEAAPQAPWPPCSELTPPSLQSVSTASASPFDVIPHNRSSSSGGAAPRAPASWEASRALPSGQRAEGSAMAAGNHSPAAGDKTGIRSQSEGNGGREREGPRGGGGGGGGRRS